MPTYSYRCLNCGVEFDAQQAFSDPALTTCESCGGSLRKLFNTIGVTFNGSGFYRTDSRAGAGASSDPGSASSSGSSESSSGSATPASAPAATPAATPATTTAPASSS